MSLVLYGAPLSPFVRKVEVVLREKGIEFEHESVNILPMPDWFKEISPARRIPVLRDKSVAADGAAGTIPDSSVICLFLEKRTPTPSVYPEDPYAYARALWYEEYTDSEIAPVSGLGLFRPIVFPRFAGKQPDLATAKKTWTEKLPRFFDYLESEIDGRDYLVGERLSIADIAVTCQLTQIELAAGLPDRARWPGLVGLVERVKARPSFEANLRICRKIVKEPVDLDAA